VTYHYKSLDKGSILIETSSQSEICTEKLCAFKVAGVPDVGISRLSFGSPGTKSHLDVALVERHKVYYKGEGGGFPQVQAMTHTQLLKRTQM
jgi:hypothetical protein